MAPTTSTAVIVFVEATGGAAMNNTVPWTWATSDVIALSFAYEAA